MKYCLIRDGVIVNIIVCDSDEIAAKLGALPASEGAYIGGEYIAPSDPEPNPEPKPEPNPEVTMEERVVFLEKDVAAMTAAIEKGLSL